MFRKLFIALVLSGLWTSAALSQSTTLPTTAPTSTAPSTSSASSIITSLVSAPPSVQLNGATSSMPAQSNASPSIPALGGAIANPVYSSASNPLTAGNTVTTADGTVVPVFGVGLFTGAMTAARSVDRPDYQLQPGDQIGIHVFGAVSTDTYQTVGADGKAYIPGVGPVSVSGITAANLQGVIASAVHKVYTSNVYVYTNVIVAGTMGVYVTGDVRRQGRYVGARGDSLLYFLDQAGGVDPARGSFRNIRVIRSGRTIAHYDLYDFILKGRLENLDFQNGDTIVVEPRGSMVGVTSLARNAFAFEAPMGAATMTGAELLALARPEANVTGIEFRGIRNGVTNAGYYPPKEFAQLTLHDGDHVDLHSDVYANTIAVSVSGDLPGPQVFILPRGTLLSELMRKIPLEATDIDPTAVHLRRPEVATEQTAALNQSVYDLQKQVFSYSPLTPEMATIQTAEASLISQFAAQVKSALPDGNVVVYSDGHFHDIILKDNDVVALPSRTDVVLVTGEVLAPGGFIHANGERIRDYVRRAGGFSTNANQKDIVIRRLDGSAVVVNADNQPRPGDLVVVVPKVSGPYFQLVKDISTLIFQLALSTATVIKL